MKSSSVKQALVSLGLVALIFAGSSAAAGVPLWRGSLKVCAVRDNVQSSHAGQPDLLRYQFGGERQHGPVAAFADLEANPFQLQDAFLQPAPNRRHSTDGFSGRADHCETCVLIFEVGDEGDFYFTVLVSQKHGIQHTATAHFSAQPGRLVNGGLSKRSSSIEKRGVRGLWMKEQQKHG